MKFLGVEIKLQNNDTKDATKKVLPVGDVAWSEDAIFQSSIKEKYNPDKLIGRKGFAIYKKMMLDEQVKAVVKFKRDAITSRECVFELSQKVIDELGEDEAERRIEISKAIIDKMKGTFIDGLNGIMTSMWQGVSYTEKNYVHIDFEGKTYWGIETLKLKPFDTFLFDIDDFGNVNRFIQKINGRKQELDIDKFIHYVNNPEIDAQYGQSELREAYRSWFSKDMAITFWNMYLERFASGFKWINTKQSFGTPQYIALQEVLSNTVNGAGMILGKDDEFNIEFPTGKGDAFKLAVDTHDLGIARALLVPNLLGITPVASTGGSRALGDTQFEAFLWTLDQDAIRLEETINEQLFRQLGKINFGDDMWPKIKFLPISEARKIKIITLWKELITAGGVKHSETDEAHIREQLEFPEKDPDALEDEDNDDVQTDENGMVIPGQNNDGQTKDTNKEGSKKKKTKSTKLKKKLRSVNKIALTRALRRIDLAVIQKSSETLEEQKAESIANVTFSITQDLVAQTREFYAKGELEEKQGKIKVNSKLKVVLQRKINSALQSFWKLGSKHAEIEIDKAHGLAFSMKVNRERLECISKDFFKIKSFKVAGKMSDDIVALISQVISNGVKGGKTFKTIEEDIYKAVGGAGFLTAEDYRQALGAAIDPNLVNPQARINTMLRTNGFEAINEARYSYFTDPQLDGFVEALEYSSVLDNVTTQICQHLDGQIHATNSSVWQSYKPPNHFNCRGLLVAVTQIDMWVESDDPTINPSKGFA